MRDIWLYFLRLFGLDNIPRPWPGQVWRLTGGTLVEISIVDPLSAINW